MTTTRTGGVRQNVLCRCGCGFPTGQSNGYVRGHTPPRPLSMRLRALVNELEPLAHRDDVSFTPVHSEGTYGGKVHIAVDEGSYSPSPVCGALEHRGTETTDTPANCSSRQ